MKSFAAVVLLAAAASAATVPVYQTPSVVVPYSADVVRTEPVSTTYFRSGVVSHGPAASSVTYPQTYPYVAGVPARPVAYASHGQPIAYASHGQPVAYTAHGQPVAYAADYVHPAGYGYVAQPAYVAQPSYFAPSVRV